MQNQFSSTINWLIFYIFFFYFIINIFFFCFWFFQNKNWNQTTLEDADGDEKTSSHTHIEKDELAGAVEKIKKEHPDVERAFTDEEIEARIIKIHEQEKNKKEDIEKITMIAGEDLETDAYYIKTKEH